eukprot:CAMPEP_0170167246 /NCGR_PEP_ID=MMETSP0040_2-20121228/709_1 /TAXON_ID=641309 /ORGANISM="Lotharella oceanica, Strain CCMP622" /LENGTH=250 /DNA_ID=CAMNT_0010405213 /DNA_START=48 /DNA_END=800 /DNA_ORIENTATION=-
MSKRSSEAEEANPRKMHKAHSVVTKEEWLKARMEILAEEKKLSRAALALAAKRQAMPWVEVTTEYEFIDGECKKCKLASLFKKTDELVVYHLMYQDDWENGCSSCSAWLDSLNGAYPHIAQRTNLVCIAKANYAKVSKFLKDKGWDIPCYSSAGTSFNKDFGVEFSEEERKSGAKVYNFGASTWTYAEQAPGMSVFHKDENGKIFHTYSAYGPGLVPFNCMFGVIDCIVPGRAEKGRRNMWWIKHKEEYE